MKKKKEDIKSGRKLITEKESTKKRSRHHVAWKKVVPFKSVRS